MQSTPQAPSTPQPFTINVSDVPRTAEEVRALRIKMDDLREELQDAASRRRTVSEQLDDADSRALPGLQSRLDVLDDRIVQIEKDITTTGLMLKAAPPAALVGGTSQDPDPNLIIERLSGDIIPIVAIVSIFVFAPFALAISRFIWKRSTATVRSAPVSDHATQHRLEQLQQAVDTIAIEVERISEGQRFMTKLMGGVDKERALGAGAAEPIRASQKSAIPRERG